MSLLPIADVVLPFFAQIPAGDNPPTAADAAATSAGCLTCGGSFVIFIFLAIGYLIFHFWMLIWVARDAKARGMDSSILWMLLVFFTGLIGLLIYVLARPQGNTIKCTSCGNSRLQSSATCPHCGNA
jgi:hypothetical protein